MPPTPLVRAALALVAASALACSRPGEVAVITMVDGGGEIRILLRSDEAPRTVENFKKLAESGAYDGTTFHLVIPGFIVQGGDPNSKNDLPADDGFGGPGYTIEDELNDLKHVRGTVSMARPPDKPDSAGSQFFIVLGDRGPTGEDWSKTLDGTYTAFGTVISGMEAVDRISQVPHGHSGYPAQENRPDVNQVIGSVRIEPAQKK
jgi:cyclophilin family peptidyl-prolyl cis-trans isomerase